MVPQNVNGVCLPMEKRKKFQGVLNILSFKIKYSILDKNTYNFNKIRFRIGIILT